MMNYTFIPEMESLNKSIEKQYWYEVMILEKSLEQEGRTLDEEEFLQELFEDDFGLGMATNFYLERCEGIKFNADMGWDMVIFVKKMADERLQELDHELLSSGDSIEELVNKYAYDYILNNYLGWGRGEVDYYERYNIINK